MRHNPPRLYNFAAPAATAQDDLSDQLMSFSSKLSSKNNSETRLALDPDETVYIVFIGINDCGTTERDELEPVIQDIFDSALHDLYVRAGARNFIIFDVPPVDRSPQALESESSDLIEDRVETWNETLQTQTTEFGLSSTEATVFLSSAHQVLTDVLDDPLEYEFSEGDPADEGGGIWVDELHLTSEVHDILAEQLLRAVLNSVPDA
ncbi:hypothetical protein BD311DRAFT_771330 [Dichomitus squalens]|uniref:Carbohydrate esterase family 16 protein n=1 Tax=Dichomitus squalens TaxID=114155 RepID=A0A4Q9M6K4_9APHY|nr:hypothetical protein BD311DRAFT_771330 [Dichomitus squalens]TBU52084.1 hypothetical protein BD310DRAFT_982102 [Dichomitus squalens]